MSAAGINPVLHRRCACEGKARFPSFALAQQAARRIRRSRDYAVGPYRCGFCDGFHVGRSARRPRPAPEHEGWDE